MLNCLNIVMVILVVGLTSACHSMPEVFRPGAWILDQGPKEGSAEFKQAWQDGCESGMASMSNTMYKMSYRFRQDAALRNNPVYYKTWKDTYTFCRHYLYGTLRQGNVRMVLPTKNNTFLNGFGTVSIFESGPLNNLGPGGQGEFLQNFGVTGGDAQGPLESMGGVLDFSGDMLGGGNNMGLGMYEGWDFRPTNNLVPY